MSDFCIYWIDQIVKQVPIVSWVGLLMAMTMLAFWFTKRWAPTPILALCCALYAVTPYLPSTTHF